MSVSFGGGVGRLREVCGTVSGMAMLAGFKYPVEDPKDQDARTKNYARVQKMAGMFREKHHSIICRELPVWLDGCSTKKSNQRSPSKSMATVVPSPKREVMCTEAPYLRKMRKLRLNPIPRPANAWALLAR